MDSIVTEKIRETSQITQEDDKLGYYNLAKHLLDYILSKKFPITVGFYGKWGSGKTVLANYMKEISNKKKIEFIRFDVVAYRNNSNDLFWYFITRISKFKLTDIVSGTGLLGAIKMLAKKKFGDDASEIIQVFIENENLRDKIADKIIERCDSDKKYFVVIDNLDRLTPQDAITFLEQLKFLFLSDSKFKLDNFAFLLLCDFDIISSEIKKVYDDKIDVRDYLNKLIEVPFYLPSFESVQVSDLAKSFLNIKLPKDSIKNIINVFESTNLNTPRDIKSYLLELDMIYMIAKSRGHSEKFLLENLAKILAMQIIKTKYFGIYQFLKYEKDKLYSNHLDTYNFIASYTGYKYKGTNRGESEISMSEDIEDLRIKKETSISHQILVTCKLLLKNTPTNEIKLDRSIEKIIEIIDSASQNISISLKETV